MQICLGYINLPKSSLMNKNATEYEIQPIVTESITILALLTVLNEAALCG